MDSLPPPYHFAYCDILIFKKPMSLTGLSTSKLPDKQRSTTAQRLSTRIRAPIEAPSFKSNTKTRTFRKTYRTIKMPAKRDHMCPTRI